MYTTLPFSSTTVPGRCSTVLCRCENTAVLGERKNVNLPGVVVDLPTITEKDVNDIMNWGVPNRIDFIAASFVRKGSDLKAIRDLLGPEYSKSIHIISKVSGSPLIPCVGVAAEKS